MATVDLAGLGAVTTAVGLGVIEVHHAGLPPPSLHEETAERYVVQLQQLLPRGRAWSRGADAELTLLLRGWADEFARVDLRASDLLAETVPSAAVELLPDWETALDLDGSNSSLAARQAAVAARLLAGADFTASAEAIAALGEQFGVDLEVLDGQHAPFVAGSVAGAALTQPQWRYVWTVRGQAPLSAELRAAIEFVKPLHTHVVFEEV